MNTTAIADLICAVFICVMYARNFTNGALSGSNRQMNLCLGLMSCTLLADAGAYVLVGPAYPLALRYFLNLLSFTAAGINMIAFTYYSQALVSEAAPVNPWPYRVLKAAEYLWLMAMIYEYIAGHLVSYDADGLETVNFEYPTYIVVLNLLITLALTVLNWINRHRIGKSIAVPLVLFALVPIFTTLLYTLAGIDFAFAMSALTLVLVAEVVQKKQTQRLRQEQTARQALEKQQLQDALDAARKEAQRNDILIEAVNGGKFNYQISADDRIIGSIYAEMDGRRIGADPSVRQDWLDLLHPEDRDRVRGAFRACICDHTGKTPYDATFRMKGEDGSYRWMRSGGRVIRQEDGSGEFYGISLDITGQIEKETQREKQLAEALAMADAANRAKTNFLFNMSHDIRTPMNAIIGFTNIAKKEIDHREKALDSLNKVQLSSEILLNLINDVLDMSRIESGKVELHEEKYEIIRAFDSFEPAMAGLAAAKDIDLRFSIGTIRDRYIFADGPRFDRVLINIISNAIKYTPAGGRVSVTAEQAEDTVPGFGNYRFTVTDNGIGMSEEFQQHMYEDFTREENSTAGGVQGTGLGLSLAKRIVDMMGGSVSCVSRQGVGTCFTLLFPFRLQTEADIAQEADAAQEEKTVDLRGRRALLVDDNELNREIAGEILTDEGIAVETAADGREAVNKVCDRGAAYYDFILMDIQMPVMDGYEAAKEIRRRLPDLKAPMIALSANAFAEDRKKSLEAGMDDHVAKPINVRELIAALARFLP